MKIHSKNQLSVLVIVGSVLISCGSGEKVTRPAGHSFNDYYSGEFLDRHS